MRLMNDDAHGIGHHHQYRRARQAVTVDRVIMLPAPHSPNQKVASGAIINI